jgi:hypothetical protein
MDSIADGGFAIRSTNPCNPNHQASTSSLETASTIMNQIPGNPKMIDIPNIPASNAKSVALE